MTIFPAHQLPDRAPRRIYKSHAWQATAGVAVIMAVAAGVIAVTDRMNHPELLLLPLLLALIFGLIAARRMLRSYRGTNWLLRQCDEGLYINLRSYMNHHLPRDSHQIVFLAADEIAAVRKVYEKKVLPDRTGESAAHFAHIDIVLRHEDTAPLAEALRTERRLEAGRRGGKHHDYPVRLPTPGIVRVCWDWIKPNEDLSLNLLAEQYALAPEASEATPGWDQMSNAEKDTYIDALWEHGQIDEAVRAYRVRHNVSARRAREYFAGR